MHRISPKKLCTYHNEQLIVLQCYVYFCEVLCSCCGQRNVLAVFVTKLSQRFSKSENGNMKLRVADFLTHKRDIGALLPGRLSRAALELLMSLCHTRSYLVHCISTTPHRNICSITAQQALHSDLYIIFSERFGTFLGLQSPFSTEITDSYSLWSFCDVF